MYRLVFAIGLPIGTFRSSRPSTRYTEDQMVVSVGPYMFHTEPQQAASLRASSGGSASPPTRALRFLPPCQPHSNRSLQVVGVACMTVARDVFSKSFSRLPSNVASRLATMRRAPNKSGRNSSRPAISNEIVVTATSASWLSSPGSRRIEHRKLTTLLCSSWTPFGLPVDPDV